MQNDIATIQIIASGIASYCDHIAILDGTEDEDDAAHNARCFAQVKAGIAKLSELLDRAFTAA
jgi:hypothetical protein